jgi:hypothetical protein
MNTILHLATAVLIAAAGPASHAPGTDATAQWAGASSAEFAAASALDLRRQPAVGEALRAHGFRSDRLGRAEERALAEMMSELYPHLDPRRDRLTANQATALVYVALVRPGTPDRGYGRPRRAACESVMETAAGAERVFATPGRSQPRYLTSVEVQRVRAATRGLEDDALQCGDRRLSDASADLARTLSGGRVEREGVARQLARVRSLSRLAAASN